jgi:hypothetical protein
MGTLGFAHPILLLSDGHERSLFAHPTGSALPSTCSAVTGIEPPVFVSFGAELDRATIEKKNHHSSDRDGQ